MHLGALLALGAIVACAVSAFWRRAQGTAVEDGRRRVGRAAGGQPQKCPEIVDHRLEDASREPPTGLLVDGLPRREIVGQHAPGSSGAYDPSQGVEDFAQVVSALDSILADQR